MCLHYSSEHKANDDCWKISRVFSAKEEIPLKSYEHYIAFIICNPAQPACYLRTCQYCSGISKLKEQLSTIMDNNLIDKFVSIKSGSLVIGKHWRQLTNLQKTM